MSEGTTMYCGDNCNHTGPHRYPPGEHPVERAYGVRYATMTEPTTAAGVTLERIVRNAMPAADGVRDFILRIEAEARAAALDEARAAVEALERIPHEGTRTRCLAALDALREVADKV